VPSRSKEASMIEPAACNGQPSTPLKRPSAGAGIIVRETPGFIQQRCSNRARPCRTRSTRAGLYAGLANRPARRAAIVAAVIASESLVFIDLYLPAGSPAIGQQSVLRSSRGHCSSTDGISGDRFGQHR
jgi:hypothetical protein